MITQMPIKCRKYPNHFSIFFSPQSMNPDRNQKKVTNAFGFLHRHLGKYERTTQPYSFTQCSFNPKILLYVISLEYDSQVLWWKKGKHDTITSCYSAPYKSTEFINLYFIFSMSPLVHVWFIFPSKAWNRLFSQIGTDEISGALSALYSILNHLI